MRNQIGTFICRLRKEKGYTQKQLAEKLNVSPKTVSKWETDAGYPDISMIATLAQLFEITAEQLLGAENKPTLQNGGNMKRVKFYYCESCGNVLTGTGTATISCCGRKLNPLEIQKMNDVHEVKIDYLDDDYFLQLSHEMEKDHFISFVAWASFDRVMIVRLYPEQNAELHMYLPRKGDLYVFCNKDGLFHRKL